MKKDHILITLIIFFSSCIESKEYNDKNEYKNKISIDKIQDSEMAFSQFCDSVRNIPLETTENSLIGNVNKVEMLEDWLFLLDRDMTNSVFIFKTSGEFISVINNRGKGPQEYLSVDDITINRRRKEVVLLDKEGRKLLFFDFAGNFIETTKFDFWASNVEFIGEDLFLFDLSSVERDHNLLITDRKGHQLKKMIPFKGEPFSVRTSKMFSSLSKYKNGININFSLSNKIYFLDSESQQLELNGFIDFKDQGILEDELEEIQTLAQFHELSDNGLRLGNEIFLESSRYVYMFTAKGEEFINVFFDKREDKWYEKHFPDDITGIPFTYGIGIEGDVMISFIFPSLLVNMWDALPDVEKGKAKNNYLWNLIKTTEVDGNPIIRLMYLKK